MSASTKSKLKPIAKPTSREVPMTESDYETIYSNYIGVEATPFDVALMFAEIDNNRSGDGQIIAIPKVKVIMAPEQAANLMRMLQEVLNKYIQRTGVLRQAAIQADLEANSEVQSDR